MSAIEVEAKSPLLQALTSQDLTIGNGQASALAKWAVLKAIVGEHASEEHLTPYDDRCALMSGQAIPPYFRVFTAKHYSKIRTAYLRHSATISLSQKGPVPPLPKGINRNVQITTLIVGPLCFHVTATRVHDVAITLLDPIRPMHRIHPAPVDSVDLNQSFVLSDIDMHFNSQAIERIMRHPRVKYGGDVPPG
jgi:hypothetical protein